MATDSLQRNHPPQVPSVFPNTERRIVQLSSSKAATRFASVLAFFVLSFSGPTFGTEPLSRIAFGSCADQKLPQPIWDAVVEEKPQLFVFLGDNVYADT